MGKLLFKHEWYYKDEDLITDILVNKEFKYFLTAT